MQKPFTLHGLRFRSRPQSRYTVQGLESGCNWAISSGGSSVFLGARTPEEVASLLFGNIFVENCMKMKEIGPRGWEGVGIPSISPFLLAVNVSISITNLHCILWEWVILVYNILYYIAILMHHFPNRLSRCVGTYDYYTHFLYHKPWILGSPLVARMVHSHCTGPGLVGTKWKVRYQVEMPTLVSDRDQVPLLPIAPVPFPLLVPVPVWISH